MCHHIYMSGLSTRSSSGSLHLKEGRPDLGGSFALICLQRLSVPHVATRRCDERHNRHTRGASFPVLSY